MESLAGTTIGGYSLVRSIGYGPTGEMLIAEKESENPYAVKVLHKKLSLFTKVESYWEEIQEAAKLSNPYTTIPTIGDWSKAGRFFMVMPLLEGLDLAEVVQQQGNLPARQVLLLMGQVCLALESAHEAGLVHGAVKPRNIFLVPKGDPTRFTTRLLDFASSSLLDTEKIPDAAIGEIGVADPSYLAPEQFGGKTLAASDVYALGVILYETLIGQTPFPGNYEEIAQQQTSLDPELPSVMPDGLATIILKAMAKDPARRYESIAALREALEAWASSSPSELSEEPIALFSDELVATADDGEDAPAKQGTSDQTVRVAVDDIDDLFDEEEPEEEVLVMPSPARQESAEAEPAAPPAEEPEPAAEETEPAAEPEVPPAPTSTKKKKGKKRRKKPPAPPRAKDKAAAEPAAAMAMESYREGESDVVDLPVERSVKAFVADLGPVSVDQAPAGTNGESLDGALDEFIRQAHSWSAQLPPSVVQGESLELLAKPPQPEPEPEPAVAPAPALTAPEIPSQLTQAPPPKQKSVAGWIIGSLLIGALGMFVVTKLMPDPTPPPAATSEVTPPPAAEPQKPAPADEPRQARADEPPAAPAKEAPAKADEEKTAAAEPAAAPGPETAPLDETKEAASPPPGDEKTAPAAETKAEPKAAPAAEPRPAAVAKAKPAPASKPRVAVAKKKARPAVAKKKRPRVKRPKARPAVAKKAKKRPKKKPPKKKPPKKKKPKSDWVDPFSQ